MLPKVQSRIVSTVLPSTGKTVKFRPMQGREEKLLLLAKEAGVQREIITTVCQIVNNCMLDPDFIIGKAPIFDVEWLFLQIRIASIGPTSKVAYVDHSDEKRYEFDIELENVLVEGDASRESVVKLDEDVGVSLRWPPAMAFVSDQVVNAETDSESAFQLALSCVDVVYSGDQAIQADDEPRQELEDFVSSWSVEAYEKLMAWVGDVPGLRYDIKYVNSKGEEREIVLRNLTDFFRFS